MKVVPCLAGLEVDGPGDDEGAAGRAGQRPSGAGRKALAPYLSTNNPNNIRTYMLKL